MPQLGIRFDFRNPASLATVDTAARYASALEMCEWADRLGFGSVTLSEHHGCDDDYLPSPLVMAAAIAARTRHARIRIAAIVAPLHDPLRLAEDIAVLDNLSAGRAEVVLTNGYVPSEFSMFDRRLADRVPLVTEAVEVLHRAWTGEPFEFRGRTVRVTPRPAQQPRVPILLGGSSDPAARRAARIADGFIPSLPVYWEVYRDELRRIGKPDIGPMPGGTGSFLHIAEDPDAAWGRLAPYAMHEMNAYGAWATEGQADTGYQPMTDADALRATGLYPVWTPDEAVERIRALGPHGSVLLHPLMGGSPPELGWESLRLFETAVLPRLG